MPQGPTCEVCGKPDREKPQCFQGCPYCCELHRKVLMKEMTHEQASGDWIYGRSHDRAS